MGSDAGAGGSGLDADVGDAGGRRAVVLFWAVAAGDDSPSSRMLQEAGSQSPAAVQAARGAEQRRKNDRAVEAQIDALEKQKAEAEKDKGKGNEGRERGGGSSAEEETVIVPDWKR